MLNYYDSKNKKLISFDDTLVIEKKTDFNSDRDFCIDDKGFKLLEALFTKDKQIEFQDNLLVIDKAKIKTLQDKPVKINDDFENEITIKIDLLNEAYNFVSKNQTKSVLTGVYVNVLGTITATDSFKLYSYDLGESNNGVIIDSILIKEISKYSGNCIISYNENTIKCQINDDITIYGRVILGQYPKVSSILNLNDYVNHTFYAMKLKDAIEIGKLVGDNILVKFENENVKFIGENEYTKEIGTDFNITLSLEHLNIALNCIDTAFDFYYINEIKPVKFVIGGCKNIVLLPIRK